MQDTQQQVGGGDPTFIWESHTQHIKCESCGWLQVSVYKMLKSLWYLTLPCCFGLLIIIGIQPFGWFGQRPELSQATGMALVRCILGKFLGVVCHCFPVLRRSHFRHQVSPRPPRRERSWRRKVELWARMLSGNFAEMMTSTPFLGIFYMPVFWVQN